MKKLSFILLSCIIMLSSCNTGSTKPDVFQLQTDAKMYSDSLVNYLQAKSELEQVRALMAINNNYADRQNVKLSWQQIDGAVKYRIVISENKKLSDAYEYYTTECELNPDILCPDTKYYVKIYALDGDNKEIEFSSVHNFTTEAGVTARIVNIDGVDNVRDLGGWTANGTKVKYGMLFRGMSTDGMTETGIDNFANKLKIKTEIDVRTDGGIGKEIEGLNYKQCGMWQYGMIIPNFVSKPAKDNNTVVRSYDNGSPNGIRAIFNLLADESNYPMYIHCAWGADRTGTISYLINGLLGVSYDDLARDFELTSFSKCGPRYRSVIALPTFGTSGVMLNTTANYIGFGELNSLMLSKYGVAGKPLSYAIENYLLTVCGVSQDAIDGVRRIMLEKQVSFERVKIAETEE